MQLQYCVIDLLKLLFIFFLLNTLLVQSRDMMADGG